MSELLRVFTSRAVEILNGSNINSFGIQSHPEIYQSARFKTWLVLCQVNDVEPLRAGMIEFLRSQVAIKKIEDLGTEWAKVIPEFLFLGNAITKDKSYQIIKESKIEVAFVKDKALYAEQRMRLADTLLSLAHLKSLSHSSNLDYMTILKIMTFVERCFDFKMQLPD